jgi:hypothetical protein
MNYIKAVIFCSCALIFIGGVSAVFDYFDPEIQRLFGEGPSGWRYSSPFIYLLAAVADMSLGAGVIWAVIRAHGRSRERSILVVSVSFIFIYILLSLAVSN